MSRPSWKGEAKANANGWQTFSDAIVRVLSQQKELLVFILWGGFAQRKGKVIAARRRDRAPVATERNQVCVCVLFADKRLAC